LGLAAAFEAGAFEDLVTFGEELQDRIAPDREFQFFARLAAGHLALDNPRRALQIAMVVLEADRAGRIIAYDEDRPELYWVAFQASLAVEDNELMELWAGEFAPYVTGDRRRLYFETLSRYRASQGQGVQALANFLELLDTDPGPQFFTDSMTVALTLDIFRALQDGDSEGHTAGLTFPWRVMRLICRERQTSSAWHTRTRSPYLPPGRKHGRGWERGSSIGTRPTSWD
jgi:hypothetical protein